MSEGGKKILFFVSEGGTENTRFCPVGSRRISSQPLLFFSPNQNDRFLSDNKLVNWQLERTLHIIAHNNTHTCHLTKCNTADFFSFFFYCAIVLIQYRISRSLYMRLWPGAQPLLIFREYHDITVNYEKYVMRVFSHCCKVYLSHCPEFIQAQF